MVGCAEHSMIMKRSGGVVVVSVIVCLSLTTHVLGHQLPNGGKIWALLVAGSNGYDNYRHQADVCHAYQILHANGIPDENIIVMMYDDIAYNEENPDKGVIINQPGGPNVYKGVLKDYTGNTVNSTNFLKILAGDEDAMKGIGSGRVIKSGPKDHVFVNFADHGAPGLVAFPNDELYASDLMPTLKKMAANKQFAKLVMYVEACESGSMFDGILPDDINIFTVTAADPHESSYACYFDEKLDTYLGDVFSVMWMQDTEKENIHQEKLHHQFEVVRAETNTSHVEEYGNLDIGSLHVSDFMGWTTTNKFSSSKLPPMDDVVPSRDVPIARLERKKEAAGDSKEQQHYSFQLHKALKYRRHLERIVDEIVILAVGKDEAKAEELKHDTYNLREEDFDCYKKLVSALSESCFKISKNPHVLSQLYLFANMCGRPEISEKSVINAIKKVCSSQHVLVGVN